MTIQLDLHGMIVYDLEGSDGGSNELVVDRQS